MEEDSFLTSGTSCARTEGRLHGLPAERGAETPSSLILGLQLGLWRTHPRRGLGLVVWSRVQVCPASLIVSALMVWRSFHGRQDLTRCECEHAGGRRS